MNRYGSVIIGILFLCSAVLSADEIATVNDGRKVRLKSDGTWEYLSPQEAARADAQASTVEKTASSAEKSEGPSISNFVFELHASKSFDFRSVSWGMNKQQVKSAEKLKLIDEYKDSLKYDHEIQGIRCNVYYVFESDKLVSARYTMVRKHFDPADYNADFIALKKHLTQTFGPAASVQDFWNNEMYKDDETKYGFAVSIGFLTRTVNWKQERSKVLLQMEGINHEVFTNVKYSSVAK